MAAAGQAERAGRRKRRQRGISEYSAQRDREGGLAKGILASYDAACGLTSRSMLDADKSRADSSS